MFIKVPSKQPSPLFSRNTITAGNYDSRPVKDVKDDVKNSGIEICWEKQNMYLTNLLDNTVIDESPNRNVK